MIDAKGIAALDRRIGFGSILLLFFASTAAALLVYGVARFLARQKSHGPSPRSPLRT